MAARAVAVDSVLNDSCPHEIRRHDDDGDDECDGRDQGSEQGANDASAYSEQEGDEGKATRNRV